MLNYEVKKKNKEFEKKAIQRIKVGLVLNEFGEANKIKIEENEIQAEIQKQLRMMPGQEKMVMDFYQKNPSAVASLRGTVYEEKIINLIKDKAKVNKKEKNYALANKCRGAKCLRRRRLPTLGRGGVGRGAREGKPSP